MSPTPAEVEAGHAFYTKRSLALYDLAILWYFSRLAWKCPAPRLLQHYDEHVSSNHLDIGVGTGYFQNRCRFDSSTPRVALMDLNENCLDVASRRLARYGPEVYCADVLEPIPFDIRSFDSVGSNYLLHCLPGDIASKGVVFDHLRPLMNPGGRVFGATLLHDGVERNWLARTVMERNNKHGIFANVDDSLDGLRSTLAEHLDNSVVDVVGCVGAFSGSVPT